MTPANQLETVLRYAYLHGFSAEQWLEPTKECLEKENLESDLCSLLIRGIFSFTRVSDQLLESYLTIATTGKSNIDNTVHSSNVVIQPVTLVNQLASLCEATANKHPHQWHFFLRLLPTLLSFDTDSIVSDLQQGQENVWIPILRQTLQLLSHLVAVGLFSGWYSQSPVLSSAISFHNPNTQLDSQFSFQSQHSMRFDADATLDDSTQQVEEEDQDEPMKAHKAESLSNASADVDTEKKKSIEIENAALAAQIMIYLIEKKDAKRIFEAEKTNEPWMACQEKLDHKKKTVKPNAVASQNPHIQKLVGLIQRLTDRDLERRLAVHMKYHELEDEGTARAMPSAGLMGLMYHMVQIRPTLEDKAIVHHLLKLQTIKGSFDESFYLELWLTGLTGLREASLNTSCKPLPDEKGEKNEKAEKKCSSFAATNRLLWKSLVLVKLPYLIHQLRLKKSEQQLDKADSSDEDETVYNSIEASLKELKAFSGLINACSISACCTEFYAPDSMPSILVDRIAFNGSENDDDEDIMKMINDMNYESEVNSPLVTKSIRSTSNHDIYTNIVYVCQNYGFVRPKVASELLKKKSDDSMMDIDEANDKISPITTMDQNIELRFKALKNTISFSSLIELLHIGLVSPIYLRRIIDFVLDLIRTQSIANDFHGLSEICEALSECPCYFDLIFQLCNPSELLGPLENICNHWNPMDNQLDEVESTSRLQEGEEELEGAQLLYYKYGKILGVVFYVIKHFKLYRNMNEIFSHKEGFIYKYFTQGPIIFGFDAVDPSMELVIDSWMNALTGDGLSDDLLLSTKPQTLLLAVPTIIQRGILLTGNHQIEEETLLGMIFYFQKQFLSFSLSSILSIISEFLLEDYSGIALNCLNRLIVTKNKLPNDINLYSILGLLESAEELKQQEIAFSPSKEETQSLITLIKELKQYIINNNRLFNQERSIHFETATTNLSPTTLFEKASLMFRYIVKSGRSMYMSDVDADTQSLWASNTNTGAQVSHYLDMVMFQTALEIGGAHWFVDMIVQQVLEAGKSGGAVRAAELGSCLITIPSPRLANTHSNSVNLLRCLLQQVLPSRLYVCAKQNMSYFQGQTLGVFVSDCLVLMQESVYDLGKKFFETLVIDSENPKRNIKKREIDIDYDRQTEEEDTQFADWSEEVTKSAIWRGFIKGLMSNPMVEEIWPNAFI